VNRTCLFCLDGECCGREIEEEWGKVQRRVQHMIDLNDWCTKSRLHNTREDQQPKRTRKVVE